MLEDLKKAKEKSYLEERKPQRWRALTIFKDNSEGHLYTGKDPITVKNNFQEAVDFLYDETQLKFIKKIELQKWFGTPDAGCWKTMKQLTYYKD
jgi:hypothetical protein